MKSYMSVSIDGQVENWVKPNNYKAINRKKRVNAIKVDSTNNYRYINVDSTNNLVDHDNEFGIKLAYKQKAGVIYMTREEFEAHNFQRSLKRELHDTLRYYLYDKENKCSKVSETRFRKIYSAISSLINRLEDYNISKSSD